MIIGLVLDLCPTELQRGPGLRLRDIGTFWSADPQHQIAKVLNAHVEYMDGDYFKTGAIKSAHLVLEGRLLPCFWWKESKTKFFAEIVIPQDLGTVHLAFPDDFEDVSSNKHDIFCFPIQFPRVEKGGNAKRKWYSRAHPKCRRHSK